MLNARVVLSNTGRLAASLFLFLRVGWMLILAGTVRVIILAGGVRTAEANLCSTGYFNGNEYRLPWKDLQTPDAMESFCATEILNTHLC